MEAALVVAIAVAGLVVAYVGYQSVVGRPGGVRRAFARTPPTTVAEAGVPGVVRLTGTAGAVGEPPVSEASGRAWIAQDLRIIAASDGATTRGVQRAVDFLLDDGTGVALVRAGGAHVAIPRDVEPPRTTLDQVPWVDALLREHGYRNGSPKTCRIRIYEGVLAPGDVAGVVGVAEPADAEARALGATIVVRAGEATVVVVRPEPG